MIYQQHFSEKEQINICQSGKSSFKKMFFQYFQEELGGGISKIFRLPIIYVILLGFAQKFGIV